MSRYACHTQRASGVSSPWLRFLRRGLSVLLISALPAFALAGNFGDCTLAPPTPNSVQAGNNEIVEIEFQVVRSPSNLGVPCTGVTGTVNADANGTIVSVLPDGPDPSPHDFIADENQTVTVRYATGPSNGDGTLFIACTASECAGHSTDAFPYQIVVVDRTLDFVGQNSFNGDPGQSIQLIVHAADDGISPLAPVPIDWIISGPGTLDTPSSNTDVNGDSFNTVNVLAATPGNDIINITATRSDAPTASVSFQIQVSVYELTVDAPAPGSQVQGGTTVILSVLYRVNGIPIDTAQVNWSFDQNPNGSSLQLGTTSTTSSGIATNVLTVGTPNIGAPASPIVVHAAIAAPAAAGLKGGAALPSAVFTLTPYDLVTVSTASGDNQSADVGVGLVAPLVVGLTRNGAPDGVGLINWTVDPPGAATLSSGQTASDGQGNSSVTVTTVNSGGLFTVTAAHHDDPTQTAVFQANGVAIGVLDLEKPSDSGDGQFGATDTPVANPLVVVATLDGAPQTGVGITWSVASGSATLSNATSPTDNAGRSSVNVTFGNTAGNVVVRATRNDDNTVFEEYFLQSFLKQLVKPPNGSGDGQSGSANAALPQPLVAVATINGAPESGVTVNWSVVSGSATLSNITNPTDSSGRSSATVTLGNSGPVVVRAARADHPSQFQDYNLTALDVRTLDKPPSNSGDGQSGMIGTTLPQPLVVFARNNGAAAAGVQVTWTASNGATVTPASVTDSTGRTQVTVQLGNTPGPVTVTRHARRCDDGERLLRAARDHHACRSRAHHREARGLRRRHQFRPGRDRDAGGAHAGERLAGCRRSGVLVVVGQRPARRRAEHFRCAGPGARRGDGRYVARSGHGERRTWPDRCGGELWIDRDRHLARCRACHRQRRQPDRRAGYARRRSRGAPHAQRRARAASRRGLERPARQRHARRGFEQDRR